MRVIVKKRIRLLSCLFAVSVFLLAGCASSGQRPDGQVQAAGATQAPAAGSTQAPAAGATQETAAGSTQEAAGQSQGADPSAQGAEGNDAAESDAGEKPALVVLGEEENDFDRAVSTRSGKKASDPNAYMLHPFAGGDGGADAGTATQAEAESGQPENRSNVPKEYTVMVYIVGSNLESRLGAATSDINEMRDSGLDYGKANLLLYTGGSRRWVSDIPNDTNNVLDLSREEEVRITAQTRSSANMGAAQTLAEFINYCTRNYPAEHYALILWDHGGGPLWGYGSDELFDNDSLLLEEMRAAMDSTEFGPDRKLDWVGFDACLMGGVENAVLWKDYARYLISSEEVEAGRGWDYHFLNAINESVEPEDVAASVVDSYGTYYEENRTEFFNPDATLSVMDLSVTDELSDSINALFDAMDKGIAEGDYARINQARSRTKAFGLGAVGSVEEAYDLVDLQDFAGQLQEMYPEECARVADAVDRMVLHATSNVEGAGGISIYVPGNNKALYNASSNLYAGGMPLPGSYQSYVDAYAGEWFSQTEIDWNLPEIEQGNGELTLQLTKEQAENISQAYYAVLRRDFGGQYVKVMIDVPVDADENGMLHIPADPMLATVVSETYESNTPWTCRQVSAGDQGNTYSTVKTYLCAANEFTDISLAIDDPIEIVFKNRKETEETEIKDIISEAEGGWTSGKGSVDVSEFTTVKDFGAFGRYPERDENGRMKPFFAWENGANYSSSPVPVDSSFRIIMKPASEFEDVFVCQIVIRDVHDGIHASELIDFPISHEREIVEAPTENGVIRYEIFDDHAEVYEYDGTDKEVEIAENISGKPVTVVAENAFYVNRDRWNEEEKLVDTVILPDTVEEIGSYALPYMMQIRFPKGLKKIGNNAFTCYRSEKIEIPDSVEAIGYAAFSLGDLTSVKLPASLQKIGSIPFSGCSELKEISIDDGNGNYKTVDGVLYTKDGKTLIQYPHAKGDSYQVEDGTETIAYGAFADSIFFFENETSLRRIGFPDTLKTIENAAFYNCKALQELELPDSLTRIGKVAFGEAYTLSLGSSKIDLLHIGPNVSKIGERAFSAIGVKNFEVDPENQTYASAGGFITDKAGDTILTAPRGVGKVVTVPEGITTLTDLVFADLTDDREFFIPDSVFRFAKDVFGDPDSTDLSGITIHCSEGSAAEAYAKKYGIRCDTGAGGGSFEGSAALTDPFREETVQNEGLTITYLVFEDHAEIADTDTEGTIPSWEVPAEYCGLPVTVLGCEDEEAYEDSSARIRKITIPGSVRYIYREWLEDDQYLEEIDVTDGNEHYRSEEGVLFTADDTLMYYPKLKGSEAYTVPEGTVKIGAHAFDNCYFTPKEVTLPDSVSVIEEGAFKSCSELTAVKMGQGLERIGENAFGYCTSLTKTDLPEGLTTIGNNAFYGTSLQNVRLPSTLESIGDSAFTVHEGFGEIVLPENLTSLGIGAFRTDVYDGETFLQDTLRIPAGLKFEKYCMDGVLVKNYEADEDNPYLTIVDGLILSKDTKTLVCVPGQREGELTVPESVQHIERNAFGECRSLTDVYLPDSVMDVGDLGKDGYDSPCPYKVHCHEGTEAQKQLEAMGVEWVKIEE